MKCLTGPERVAGKQPLSVYTHGDGVGGVPSPCPCFSPSALNEQKSLFSLLTMVEAQCLLDHPCCSHCLHRGPHLLAPTHPPEALPHHHPSCSCNLRPHTRQLRPVSCMPTRCPPRHTTHMPPPTHPRAGQSWRVQIHTTDSDRPTPHAALSGDPCGKELRENWDKHGGAGTPTPQPRGPEPRLPPPKRAGEMILAQPSLQMRPQS